MAAMLGTDAYGDRPGLVPWHSRPALLGGAARVRMSVGCGSPRPLAVCVPRPKPSRITEDDGSPPLLHCYSHPSGKKKRRSDPFPWKIFSLDTKSLMSVRHDSLSRRPFRTLAFASADDPEKPPRHETDPGTHHQ